MLAAAFAVASISSFKQQISTTSRKEEMMKVLNEFMRLFSSSAGKVNVAGKYVAMPVHRGVETNRRRVSAAARLYVSGSAGLKRFHLVPEDELSERKERVLR